VKRDQNAAGPEVTPSDDLAAVSRRSASEGPSCERCKRPLTGKKERFCSDACRMRLRRDNEATDFNGVLDLIEEAVAALRKLGGGQ
jgi:hypothetical protein